jgi:hypothetical protein
LLADFVKIIYVYYYAKTPKIISEFLPSGTAPAGYMRMGVDRKAINK